MKNRTIAITAATITAILLLGVPVAQDKGIRLNISTSAPPGIWQLKTVSADSVPERGAMVEICPPAHAIVEVFAQNGVMRPGNCPGTGLMPLLKPAAALPGDVVTLVEGEPVRVNGHALLNTEPVAGMLSYTAGTYHVADDEVWLFSSYNDNSLDSRYFGPVPMSHLRGEIQPILVSGGGPVVAYLEGEL